MCWVFVVALLEYLDDLVGTVGSAYSVLVFSSRCVDLLFVCVVYGGGSQAPDCCADSKWSKAVVGFEFGG